MRCILKRLHVSQIELVTLTDMSDTTLQKR